MYHRVKNSYRGFLLTIYSPRKREEDTCHYQRLMTSSQALFCHPDTGTNIWDNTVIKGKVSFWLQFWKLQSLIGWSHSLTTKSTLYWETYNGAKLLHLWQGWKEKEEERWWDGLLGKVLTEQAWDPEFKFPGKARHGQGRDSRIPGAYWSASLAR